MTEQHSLLSHLVCAAINYRHARRSMDKVPRAQLIELEDGLCKSVDEYLSSKETSHAD